MPVPSAPEDSISELSSSPDLSELRLLQMADSAFPIGALAHSFGLETLADAGTLHAGNLCEFLTSYLEECGFLDAVFFRSCFRLAPAPGGEFDAPRWLEFNERLSALKPAFESRVGSASLGWNFLKLVARLDENPILDQALESTASSPAGKRWEIHQATAFGLVAGALQFDESRSVTVFLHQSVANLVSACQRLMPLGQTRAAGILWQLKPVVLTTTARSSACPLDDASSFTPLLDWGAMHHPGLATRLFIS